MIVRLTILILIIWINIVKTIRLLLRWFKLQIERVFWLLIRIEKHKLNESIRLFLRKRLIFYVWLICFNRRRILTIIWLILINTILIIKIVVLINNKILRLTRRLLIVDKCINIVKIIVIIFLRKTFINKTIVTRILLLFNKTKIIYKSIKLIIKFMITIILKFHVSSIFFFFIFCKKTFMSICFVDLITSCWNFVFKSLYINQNWK